MSEIGDIIYTWVYQIRANCMPLIKEKAKEVAAVVKKEFLTLLHQIVSSKNLKQGMQ